MHELEGGAGVVVQAADQLRVVDERDPGEREQLADLLVVRLAVLAEEVPQHGGVGELGLHGLALVVQHAQRVDLGAAAGVLVQVQAGQELDQRGAVDRAALLVAEAVEQQRVVRQPERAERVVGEDDQLGVQRRVLGADGLRADLRELAVPALLRPLVAVVVAGVPELHREVALLVQVRLEGGAQHGGGALGAQRELVAAAGGEVVHLLGDDVGGLADAAGEELHVLEDRGLDVAVAGPARGGGNRLADRQEGRRTGRQQVVGALGGGEGAQLLFRHIPRRGKAGAPAAPAACWR